jgi:outer membrane protein
VRSNADNVDAMEARFEAGRRPIADVVDAQRALFQARRELAELRHQYLIDTLRLKSGAGTLDEDDVVALAGLFTGGDS